MRLIGVGDIHGQHELLVDLLDQIQPTGDDQLVFVGDYIDRGPASKQVIETLIDLKLTHLQTIFLRGNHEQMFLDALISCQVIEGNPLKGISSRWGCEVLLDTDVGVFKRNGGDKTLANYGVEMVLDSSAEAFLWPKYILLGEIPLEHLEFIQATQLFYRHGDFTFVHAGYFTLPAADRDAGDTIEEQAINDPSILLWERSSEPGQNGEILVVGHTPCGDEPRFEKGRIRLDTGAGHGRSLSAVDVLTGQGWQASPAKRN